MSNLITTLVRQARGFLQAGDAKKALDLAKRAQALSGDDVSQDKALLELLVHAYQQCGNWEAAQRYQDVLQRRYPGTQPPPTAMAAGVPAGKGTRRMASLVVGLLVLIGGSVTATVFVMDRWHQQAAPDSIPAPVPVTAATPTVSEPAAAPAPSVQAAPLAVTVAPAAPAPVAIEDLMKENIGLVVVIAQYRGDVSGNDTELNIPVDTGTAFAMTQQGHLLTSKHVIQVAGENPPPPNLAKADMPTLTFRGLQYLVCFGSDPSGRLPATLVRESPQFDLAILKVERQFPHPFVVSRTTPHVQDRVFACGFPGGVQEMLKDLSLTPERQKSIVTKWKQDQKFNLLDELSPDCFTPSLTDGIVSVAERNIDSISYLQVSAAAQPGNSGGPILNDKNEVLGIMTYRLTGWETYNFALRLEQLANDLQVLPSQP